MRGVRRARRVLDGRIEAAFGMVGPMSRRELGTGDIPAPVTAALNDRIGDLDLSRLAAALAEPDRAYWDQLQPGSAEHRRATIHFALHYGLDGSPSRTKLSSVAPPDEVHSMSRGSRAAGGSIYHADLVFGALERACAAIGDGGRILDFGCSSGRVIRVVKAYRPDLASYGCDPNKDAIAWATANLPDIKFSVSPLRPPLAFGESFFDCVFAISIWSHFGSAPATEWLEEMRRVIKPGGLLVVTAHSFASVTYYAKNRLRAPEDLRSVLASMLISGVGFLPVFARRGDWGIVDADWGESYISPEWLLNVATPNWDVLLYRSGANEGNQDVAVLRRRGDGKSL
jgi:SAM-dependent methyltransferase